MKRYFAWILATGLSCCLAMGVFAQSNRGRISGQVTDSSGGAIAGAKVTIENTGTHVVRTLQTNTQGDYVATDIEPGIYSVKAEAGNFKSVVRENVQLEVANELKIDFQLQPGAISEVVEVTDVVPLTETSNAVLNGVLSNKAINELPLQGRDFQNLLPLHPGVQRDPGGGFHTLTSNGMRPDANNFIIDGANDNDIYYGETVVNDAGISGTPCQHAAAGRDSGIQYPGATASRLRAETRRGGEYRHQVRHGQNSWHRLLFQSQQRVRCA